MALLPSRHRSNRSSPHESGSGTPALAANGARRLGCRLERRQADIVRIGESRFLTADRAYTDALIDIETSRLDDSFFKAPTLTAAVLKI